MRAIISDRPRSQNELIVNFSDVNREMAMNCTPKRKFGKCCLKLERLKRTNDGVAKPFGGRKQ